jgi:hypothetical protein
VFLDCEKHQFAACSRIQITILEVGSPIFSDFIAWMNRILMEYRFGLNNWGQSTLANATSN